MADEEGDSSVPTGPVLGPSYTMWEAALEKLKVLDYEIGYCAARGKKPFNRIHFVFPIPNVSHQFDDFIGICEWLFTEITKDPAFFKRDQYDDPNTVANKMMLALRQVDFRLSFPAQKLRQANGENICAVIEFLTDKALEAKKFKWGTPIYPDSNNMDDAVANEADDADQDDAIADDIDIEDDHDAAGDIDLGAGGDINSDLNESILDGSSRQILHGQINPLEWKTELERVSQKLKTSQITSTNEWRAHVDQTVTSRENIDKLLGDTKSDLAGLTHDVADELGRLKTKERYINTQFSILSNDYKEIKVTLEELEVKTTKSNENVSKYTTELAEISEKLDDLKESFESKDNGMHDTSPLVKIKTALQHLKSEIASYELRCGVVAHSLLAARVAAANRKRMGVAKLAKKRRNRHTKAGARGGGDDSSIPSDDGDY